MIAASRTWVFAATNRTAVADNIVRLHSSDDNITLAMDFTEVLNKSTDLSTVYAVADTGAALTIANDTLTGDRQRVEFDITAGLADDTDYTVAVTVTTTDGQTLKRVGTLYCRDT